MGVEPLNAPGTRVLLQRSSLARTQTERVPLDRILDLVVDTRLGFARAVMIDDDGRVRRLTPFELGRRRAERVVQEIVTANEAGV